MVTALIILAEIRKYHNFSFDNFHLHACKIAVCGIGMLIYFDLESDVT